MEFRLFSEGDKKIYRREIIEMLRESDEDFVPPLSVRASTLDTDFKVKNTVKDGILSYYEKMNEQEILGAFSDGELLGIVSFRENFALGAADTKLPNIYVSTLVMKRSARGRGITSEMYGYLFNICFPEREVFTRTWSTNLAHTKILLRFGFHEVKRIENDRGAGIDTVYYKKDARVCAVSN